MNLLNNDIFIHFTAKNIPIPMHTFYSTASRYSHNPMHAHFIILTHSQTSTHASTLPHTPTLIQTPVHTYTNKLLYTHTPTQTPERTYIYIHTPLVQAVFRVPSELINSFPCPDASMIYDIHKSVHLQHWNTSLPPLCHKAQPLSPLLSVSLSVSVSLSLTNACRICHSQTNNQHQYLPAQNSTHELVKDT